MRDKKMLNENHLHTSNVPNESSTNAENRTQTLRKDRRDVLPVLERWRVKRDLIAVPWTA